MCPADTSPEIWRIYLDICRQMTPSEKLAKTLELSEMYRNELKAGLCERYPQAGEREIFLRCARILLGLELFERAYGEVSFEVAGYPL
jgi:hypothetical protein